MKTCPQNNKHRKPYKQGYLLYFHRSEDFQKITSSSEMGVHHSKDQKDHLLRIQERNRNLNFGFKLSFFSHFTPWTETYILPNCAGRRGLSRAVLPFLHFIHAQWKNFNCLCYTWSLEEAESSWSITILCKLVLQSLLFLQSVSIRHWRNSLLRSSCWGPVSDAV